MTGEENRGPGGSRTPVVRGLLLLGLLVCALVTGCAAPAPAADPVAELDRLTQTRNDADVAFVQAMLPHHAQGVELAGLVAARTDAGPVRDMAFRITRAQGEEIGRLRGFLTSWDTAPDTSHAMHTMPGMVDRARISVLRDARGPAFDRLWLQAMIAHHEGAVAMAEAELRDGIHRGARNTASTVVAVQRSEIATMRGMLGR